VSISVVSGRRDAVRLAAVLINPFDVRPAFWICFVRRDEMEALRINTRWMPERTHVARQREVERLDLIPVGFAPIHLVKFKGG
jgi:hypothetical protein